MKKIVIKTKEKTFFIELHDILYCRAAGSYSVIYLIQGHEIVTSMNLFNLKKRMESLNLILRVSQSILINAFYIQCINHKNRTIELESNCVIPYTIKTQELQEMIQNAYS